jgi:TM2 domain-containing membrane protein YozV
MDSNNIAKQKWALTFFLCLFGGFLGLHRFYTGHLIIGLLQLLTLGGLGIWWFLDILTILINRFKNNEGLLVQRRWVGIFWAIASMALWLFVCPTALIFAGLPKSSAPSQITTSEGLIFTIPNDSAHMDGRDESGEVEVPDINIWNNPSRAFVECTIEHGTSVSLLSAQYNNSEERYYIKVSDGACTGWVSDPFIGN